MGRLAPHRLFYRAGVSARGSQKNLRDDKLSCISRDQTAWRLNAPRSDRSRPQVARGALLGREFSYELIARVAQPQRAQADLQAALGALTGAGLLFSRGMAPRSSYLFKHALIQDAAYETQMKARAEALAPKTGNLRRLAEQIYGSWLAAEVSGKYPSAMALPNQMLNVMRHDGGAVTRSLATNVQLVTRFGIGDLALHYASRSLQTRAWSFGQC